MVYTGDMDGVVAAWNIDRIFNEDNYFPICFHNNHASAVVSITSNHELDLHASTSKTDCIMRVTSTMRYYNKIEPVLMYNKVKYEINSLIFSERGYVIMILRSSFSEYKSDIILVYSINGELINHKETNDIINCHLLDTTQYFLVYLIIKLDNWW